MKLTQTLQLVWWPPIERLENDKDECGVNLLFNAPELAFVRDQYGGIIRWRLIVGYVEIRRYA